MIDLSNHVAVITGGSRGIGAATAKLFAQAGADVVVMYERNKKAADGVVRAVTSYGVRSFAIQAKIQDERACHRAVAEIIKHFGQIDILVNSAGIWEEGAMGKTSLKEWQRTIEINLNGTFAMCNAVIPSMRKQHYGRIINISSTAGQRGEAFHSAYGASKGAINAFTKSIAPEVIVDGIWVNCVAPGWVVTDMTASEMNDRAARKKIINTIPRKKIATADEIAGPVLFLASSLSNHVVGEILNVNGGSVLFG